MMMHCHLVAAMWYCVLRAMFSNLDNTGSEVETTNVVNSNRMSIFFFSKAANFVLFWRLKAYYVLLLNSQQSPAAVRRSEQRRTAHAYIHAEQVLAFKCK